MDRWVDGWIDVERERGDGWVDGRWMDEWMDR